MKITCGSCGAKYTVSDDKVHGKTVKVKCRKCSAVIVVSSTGEVQTTGGSSAAAGGGAEPSFTVSVSDTDQRTMTMAEIVAAYNEGAIDAETYVWAEGMDDWQPLKDVDAIVDALHDAASTGGEQPTDLSSTVAMTDTAMPDRGGGNHEGYYGSSPPPAYGSQPAAFGASGGGVAAAAMGGGMGGGGMDFGSTVAMPQPAPYEPTARGASGIGFFANSPAAAAVAPGEGGAENSAIFSLNMLTSKVGAPTGGPPVGGGGMSLGVAGSGPIGTTEDSGLIDLKALAAGMGDGEGVAAHAAAAPAADGVFPLGAPPMHSIPAAASMPAPSGGGSRAIVLGLGMAVLVLAAALIFFIVKDSGETTGKTANTGTNPVDNTAGGTQPASSPAPVSPDTSGPAPDPSEASSAPPGSSSGKIAVGPRPGGPRPPPGGNPTPTPGPGSKPTPKPPPGGAKGACGCASDDLMCHMRCSQKGKKGKK